MPVAIAASDRKILLVAGTLLFLMLAASVLLAPPASQYGASIPSTYSAQSGGAKAAYSLLSQLHYPVRRWQASPLDLDAEPEDTLLILAEPVQPPSDRERKALADFVKGGGHVLFTGQNISTYFSDARVAIREPDPVWESFQPSLPSRLARGAQPITIQPQAYWDELKPSQLALYSNSDGAVVVSWQLGDGEILWWAGSTPLTNAGITQDGNLAFFLNAVRNWPAGKPYAIYWDEYFHGQRSSLWSYVSKTSLAWGILQFASLALAVLFTFSRRSGPIFVPPGGSRLSPLEFVDTLGGLYERAGAAGSAVAVSYQRLRSLLTRHLALPSNTPDAELAAAVEQRLGWKDAGLGDLLSRASASIIEPKLKPSQGLDLVQKLESCADRLIVKRAIPKEKN